VSSGLRDQDRSSNGPSQSGVIGTSNIRKGKSKGTKNIEMNKRGIHSLKSHRVEGVEHSSSYLLPDTNKRERPSRKVKKRASHWP